MSDSPLLGGIGTTSAPGMMEGDGMWPGVEDFATLFTGLTPAVGKSVGRSGPVGEKDSLQAIRHSTSDQIQEAKHEMMITSEKNRGQTRGEFTMPRRLR